MFTNPDFWQAWIDRYQELREGPLSGSVLRVLMRRSAGKLHKSATQQIASERAARAHG